MFLMPCKKLGRRRKRRIGWFDAVLVEHAISLSGVHALALTKLDALGRVDAINVCIKKRLVQDEISFSSRIKRFDASKTYLSHCLDGKSLWV